jgi:hypothetical protein
LPFTSTSRPPPLRPEPDDVEEVQQYRRESALNSAEVATLSEVQKNPANNYDQSAGLLFVANQRADRLGKLIAGPTAESPEAAASAANRTLASMTTKLKSVGIDVGAKDLVAALNLVTDQAVARATEAANSNKARDEAVASFEQAKKDAGAQIALLTNQITELRGQLDQASASVQTMTATKDAELTRQLAMSTPSSLRRSRTWTRPTCRSPSSMARSLPRMRNSRRSSRS